MDQGLFLHIKAEIDRWPVQDGIRSSDLTLLSEPLRTALTTTVREGSLGLADFARLLQLELPETSEVVDLLLDHGFLKTSRTAQDGSIEYRVRHARSGRTTGDLWNRVSGALEASPDPHPLSDLKKSGEEP